MESNYKYYAFISYKSTDEKWAKWLQVRLETYRLPSALCKRNKSLPKKLTPCFRYHTDIQPNELKTELESKLEKSKYLIVICSPRSAQSQWVGNEIDTFVKLGRKERIIPFIIDGVPYSENPSTECFHPVIKNYFPRTDDIETDKEILGVNIHEEGEDAKWIKREKAVLHVISAMLDIEFDELWKRQKRRMIRKSISYTLLLVIFVACVGYVWKSNQPVDVSVSLVESSVKNEYLPPLKSAVVVLRLDNEVKVDTFYSLSDVAVFTNIPSKYIGKPASLSVTCSRYLPTDTIVVLEQSLSLCIERDVQVYGNVDVRLFDGEQLMKNVTVEINGNNVLTDNKGRLKFFVPLSEQRPYYLIRNLQQECCDTLYMPCGKDDIVTMM